MSAFGIATNRDDMRYAFRLEFADGKIRDFDGVIDKLRIIVGNVASKTVRFRASPIHRGRYAPGPGLRYLSWLNLQPALMLFLPHHCRKHAGPVEVGVGIVEVCTTNTVVVRIDFQHQRYRTAAGFRLPATFVELGHRATDAIGFRTNRNNVSSIVPDHVAAGYPRRHREYLSVWIRGLDG